LLSSTLRLGHVLGGRLHAVRSCLSAFWQNDPSAFSISVGLFAPESKISSRLFLGAIQILM
jgi:hypothetical protein